MARPRQLNPAETAMFTADMSRLPPEHSADVALKWRERCINLMREHMSPLADGLAITGAGAYSMGLGWWDGVNEQKRDDLVLEWQQVTGPNLGIDTNAVRTPFQDVYDANGQLVHKAVADPRKWLRVPKALYPTAAFAIAAGVGVGGPTYNRYLMAPAVGGVGYVVGSWFRDMAYRSAQKKAAANGNGQLAGGNGNGNGNGNANGNGGQGNPYRGYPRAA